MFVMYTYDVPAKRTQLYRKILRRYLGHEQFSVFFGELPGSKAEKLRLELRRVVSDNDRLIEFVVENRHNIDIGIWSKTGRSEGVPSVTNDDRHKLSSLVT